MESTIPLCGSQATSTCLRRMKLAVNKSFTTSSFDLDGRVSCDGSAELVDHPLFTGSTAIRI